MIACGKKPPKKKTIAASNSNQDKPPKDCENGAQLTGKRYTPIGTGISMRGGPGIKFKKLINKKATKVLKKTKYLSVDDTTLVYEECTQGNWSWVRVISPKFLSKSHRGWIESKHLNNSPASKSDKYTGKIASSAIIPTSADQYPKTVRLYPSRVKEIDKFRKLAAMKAVDSGKCDIAILSELSLTKSTRQRLSFFVDCTNGARFRYWENEL
ncbi:hypothetical protein NBRC116587_33100 [Pseudoteredinibacter isoporae]